MEEILLRTVHFSSNTLYFVDPDQSGFSEVSGMRTSNILQFQFSRQLAPINPNDVDFRNQSDVREFIMLVVHPIPNTRNMKVLSVFSRFHLCVIYLKC